VCNKRTSRADRLTVSVSSLLFAIGREPAVGTPPGDASSSRDDNNVLHVRVVSWRVGSSVSPDETTDRDRYTTEPGWFFQRFYFIFLFFEPFVLVDTTRITILSERQTKICYFRLTRRERIA
jgi:hypothetical protein